jgi:hypothetical protein
MNDEELERLLRSQAGIRERGYRARPLPAGPAPAGSGSTVLRVATLASAAAAGALVVAIGAAVVLSGDGGPGADASPTPESTDGTPHVICAWRDLVLEAEPWDGAAGSRGTVVTVSLQDRAGRCQLARDAGARISDADGVLVEGSSGETGSVVLEPGARYTLGISWSNWCGAEPNGVVSWELRIGDGGWWEMPGQPPRPGTGLSVPVPPCNGAGQPSVLAVRGLQPAG